MKIYVTVAILMFFCGHAYSASWKLVANTQHGRIYVDTSSIKKSKKTRKFWTRLDYIHIQRTSVYVTNTELREIEYQQAKVLYSARCDQNALAQMQANYFDKGGNFLGRQQNSKLNFTEVIPDSYGDKALKVVCGKSKKKRKHT